MKNTSERTIPQTFTLSWSLREVLCEQAKKEGISISAIVQRALLREFSEKEKHQSRVNK